MVVFVIVLYWTRVCVSLCVPRNAIVWFVCDSLCGVVRLVFVSCLYLCVFVCVVLNIGSLFVMYCVTLCGLHVCGLCGDCVLRCGVV